MPPTLKQLLSDFFPGLGPSQQAYVGMVNVGITVVNATIACNTARTDAQVIASPPNTSLSVACGPVVHSLGIAPTFVNVLPLAVLPADTSMYAVNFQFITADNSAIYLRASTWTGATPVGVAARVFAVR